MEFLTRLDYGLQVEVSLWLRLWLKGRHNVFDKQIDIHDSRDVGKAGSGALHMSSELIMPKRLRSFCMSQRPQMFCVTHLSLITLLVGSSCLAP
jgi:hypothetical protein